MSAAIRGRRRQFVARGVPLLLSIALALSWGCASAPAQVAPRADAHLLNPTFLPDLEFLASAMARADYWRSQVNLPPIEARPGVGPASHARYLIKNNIKPSLIDPLVEDPKNPWYTAQGAPSSPNTLIFLADRVPANGSTLIDTWMTDPFTAFFLLGNEANRAEYGEYCEAGKCALALFAFYDPTAKTSPVRARALYPLEFPPPGAVLPAPMTAYRGAQSDPPLPFFWLSSQVRFLANCPEYAPPAGPPIILELGLHRLRPATSVAGHSIARDGHSVDQCLVDWQSYENAHGGLESLVRQIMGYYQTVVLIPREPLTPGASYTVSITVDDKDYRWSFSTASAAGLGH